MLAKLVELSGQRVPAETKIFPKGKFELFELGGKTFGRATYEPGWKWSDHVGPGLGDTRCRLAHFGYVVRGTCVVAFDDGTRAELREGELFHIPAIAHDSWVIGDEPYISLHLDHAQDYGAVR